MFFLLLDCFSLLGIQGSRAIMNSVVKLAINDLDAIPYQEASLDIWDKKYRLTSKSGEALDQSMDDTYMRVARALSDVEPESVRGQRYERFLWALRHGAIPAGLGNRRRETRTVR